MYLKFNKNSNYTSIGSLSRLSSIWKPLYVQDPIIIEHVCVSNGQNFKSNAQKVSNLEGGTHSTEPI